MDSEELKSAYPTLLRKYLFEGKEEEALYEAYKLGKECFEAKIGIEDVLNLHTQCLEDILKTLPPSGVHDIVLKSSNLIIEFSIRFGLACQNYFEILQQTDERIRNAFYQAGEALTAGLDLQKILYVILDIVKNLIESASCAAIMLLEEDRTVIKVSECLDTESEFFKDFLCEVIKEGKPEFVYDLREKKSHMTLKDGREIRSVLVLPLNLKGRTRGGLGIYLTHPHHFEEKEINLLTSFANQASAAIDNARLFSELQRHDKTLEALYSIDRVVSQTLDIEEIFKSALARAMESIDADSGSIHLLDETGENLILKTYSGLLSPEFIFTISKMKMGEGVTGRAAKMQKPEAVDISHYPDFQLLPSLEKEGIFSLASTPLIAKGKVLGAMTFTNHKYRLFSQDDLNLLASIGSQIGVAVENARLFSELQRHDKTLETLYDIDRAISQTLDIDIIFQNALSKAIEVTETEAGGIYLLEEDGETLCLKTHFGISQELASALSKIKVGQGVSGTAVKSGKPVTLDITKYPSPELLSPMVKDGIVSLAGVPLISKGKVLGAMTLANRRPRSFSRDDIEILASIGSQIGVAIQNATLFSELEKHHKMLEALYAIESVVSRSLNLEEIFDVALAKALEVTDTEAGTLYSLKGDVLHLEAGEVLRLEAIKGLSPEFKEKALVRNMGEGIPGIAAQSKKPITMDISQFPSPLLLPYVTKEGLVSFIGTPLMSKGKVVGALALGTKKKRIFTTDELDLLFSIGNAIGIAVENARLYKEVRDNAEHISALYRIARAIKASLDVGEVFDAMVGEMRSILSFDRTSICLTRGEIVEVFALAGEIVIPELGRGTRMPRSESSCGFVLDRRAGLIRNIKDIPFYEDRILFEKGIRSVIQVPLISKGEMIGVFSIESCMPDAYTQRELGLAQATADQIATSIENVRLYEDLKQANLELEKRLKELEEFHTLAVGRELRMMELKERVRSLEEGK